MCYRQGEYYCPFQIRKHCLKIMAGSRKEAAGHYLILIGHWRNFPQEIIHPQLVALHQANGSESPHLSPLN